MLESQPRIAGLPELAIRAGLVIGAGIISLLVASAVSEFNYGLANPNRNGPLVAADFNLLIAGSYTIFAFITVFLAEIPMQLSNSYTGYKVALVIQALILLPFTNIWAWTSEEWDFYKNPAYDQIGTSVFIMLVVIAGKHIAAYLYISSLAKKSQVQIALAES